MSTGKEIPQSKHKEVHLCSKEKRSWKQNNFLFVGRFIWVSVHVLHLVCSPLLTRSKQFHATLQEISVWLQGYFDAEVSVFPPCLAPIFTDCKSSSFENLFPFVLFDFQEIRDVSVERYFSGLSAFKEMFP